MGNFGQQLMEQVGNNAAGAAMGLILGGINDRRQIRQQQKLQDMQIKGQQAMGAFNYAQQMQMWKDTNYWAQVKEMQRAGVNPALMYGMSGGGGTTTGGAGGSVTGGTAPSGGGEMAAMMGMGIQGAMMRAQIANIEADTKKKEVDAAKTAGVDTENVKTDTALKAMGIENLAQGIKNQKASERLTKVTGDIAELELLIKDKTKEDAITAIQHSALRIIDEAKSALYQANVDEATWEKKIEMVEVEVAGMYLRNTQTEEQTKLTVEQAKAVAAEVIQGWHKLNIDFGNAVTGRMNYQLNKWIHDISDKTKLKVETVKGLVQAFLLKFR